jgi:transposase InsO family protein
MDEQLQREQAVQRYETGEKPKAIYTDLHKSKKWFFKWLKRFKSGDANWSKELSRKPHSSPKKIDITMEQSVIEARKQLESTPYARIGAASIDWLLEQQGAQRPGLATINRVIERNDLTRKKPLRYNPKGVDYPLIEIPKSNVLHQMDIVGPRYLKSGGRFYSINIIDAFDRRGNINPRLRQTKIDVAKAMIRSWEIIGIPTYLQMDNTLATQGSRLHPHSFGLVIRLCLLLGIQPVFIPIREPWRNGIVERFNQDFEKLFFRAQFFKSFVHLCRQALNFEIYRERNHRYSTLGGHTPIQHATDNLKLLSKNFEIPNKLAIKPGYIHLVRFIRSNRILDIFSEKFQMPLNVVYEYVWATIDTEQEKLFLYHDKKLFKQLDYKLPSTAFDLSDLER